MPETTPLALTAALAPDAMRLTCDVTLSIGGEDIVAKLTAPILPTSFGDLLPIFDSLTDALAASAAAREVAAGRTISCRAGCGACCRQAVPLSPSEARRLAALVAAMPAPRREAVTARFAPARAALAAAGLASDPAALATHDTATREAFALGYFDQRIACPFLEDESCSIHPDRPIACREYLVTSPPEACATPRGDGIKVAPIAGRVSVAVRNQEAVAEDHGLVILIDALDWAARHPAAAADTSGLILAFSTFARLA